MTKDEVLRLALEALEYHTFQTRPVASTEAAITAIKDALAQSSDSVEQEPVMEYDKEELRGTFWDTTSPKRKEWVELEAEHMDEITHTAISIVDSMLLTETKLKELNK